jgi:hypothetical protein
MYNPRCDFDGGRVFKIDPEYVLSRSLAEHAEHAELLHIFGISASLHRNTEHVTTQGALSRLDPLFIYTLLD